MMHDMIEQFIPHKVCWLYRPDLIATHAVGDLMIVVAYYVIPIMLWYISRNYQLDWRVRFIFFVYGTFIFLCGTIHLFDFIMIWKISGAFILADGILRVVTGVFSLFSAVVTGYLLFKFWELSGSVVRLAAKMKRERQELKRVTDETWGELEAILENARAILAKREQAEEA